MYRVLLAVLIFIIVMAVILGGYAWLSANPIVAQ